MIKAKRNKYLLALLYAVIIALGGYYGYKTIKLNWAMEAMYDESFNQYTGPKETDKVIVEILDYRCPHCRSMYPAVTAFQNAHPEFKFVYRHYPVFGAEPRESVIDAEIALAAGMHNKFEQAHRYLMERDMPQGVTSDEEIAAIAQMLGIGYDEFRANMKDYNMGAMLIRTMDAVAMLKINMAPLFIMNGNIKQLDQDLPPLEALQKAVAEEFGPL